ncbi:MAG: DUF4190 domain-containing protein [Actinomycetota bacterium]|nr:DUF4190 domain-containing protein [Actinomycetota bacterium]
METDGSSQPTAAAARPRTSGAAIASLVLGILGLFAIPLITSLAAIVLGRRAQREIAESPGLSGEGLAKAGVILGWIGVALMVAGIIIGVLFAIVSA